jgi:predicted Ser/Thr protein kinase
VAVSSNISGPSGNERQLIDAALRDAEQLAQMDVAFAPPPDSFTGYTILREVHRGGQGVVYQAVQESTSRKVAIKVLREGPFASEADRARFGREVEILGQLNHPSIVAIHDTGVGAGHHFLVMDYISGQPLDVYMASGERSVDETLRLFATICEAVNAAHLRGVIHRDLKPSNVRIDAEGVPHVLDFGLARITISGGGDNGPARAKTMTGQFVGSLPWAAPEQAEGVPSKIDMRTDVYSLGVILYQMLTGKFPYEVMGNMRDVLDRIMKAVPARPSTVRRQINDEVETIVLKCLQKQPERRYQSAGELARDVHRYLTGEPIEAKRDSTAYVLRKQLRKHRVPVAFAAVFIVVVTAGFVVSLAFWRQAVEQRDSAEQARVAEAEQRRVAEVNEAKAQQATQFIQQMLSGIDPEIAGGLDKTLMRMILDDAAAKIETELVGQPEVEASIRATIGSTYQAIGEYPLSRAGIPRPSRFCFGRWRSVSAY